MSQLRELIGRTDIYLVDLLLSEKAPLDLPVLDAGCGQGRNLHILRNANCEIFAIDQDAMRVESVRALDPLHGDAHHYRVGDLSATGFDSSQFGLVICNAVLHFADDEDHFNRMVEELWRVLAPGGVLFCRLASSIGIEPTIQPSIGKQDRRWHRLPDGSDRFLVDLDFLLLQTKKLNAELVTPIKTINVQGLRCMTNWVLKKN